MSETGTTDDRNYGRAPDKRNIYDLQAIEECDRCDWSPAVLICTDDVEESGKHWECYNCGVSSDA